MKGAGVLSKEEKGKVFWHGSFYEGLQLEVHQYKDFLTYEKEHELSKEALKVDVLVIKNENNVKIDKDIGQIFRVHNLVEFVRQEAAYSARKSVQRKLMLQM